MRSALAAERGFTLVELLVVITLSIGVLGATLTTFNNLYQASHDNNARHDTAELARNALDVQARQLRNIAKRAASPVIDTLAPYDLVFQTSNPTRAWVRYCLDTSVAPASAQRGRLWTAELDVAGSTTGTSVTSAMKTGCPGTGWSTARVVADYVTNRRAGLDRPLFAYTCTTGTACTADPSTYDQVVSVTAQTLVDTTPGTGAPELRVVSGVHLRNQNQAPVARFVSSPTSTSRTIVLNASESTDFEERTMSYYWFKQALPATASINCAQPSVTGSESPRTLWGAAGFIGRGVTLTHTFPASDGATGTLVNVGLVVCDAGDRFGTLGVPPGAAATARIPT